MGYGLYGLVSSVVNQGLRESERAQRQKRKLEEKQYQMSLAEGEVQEFEQLLENLTSFHKDCSPKFNWQEKVSTPPPQKPQRENVHENAAKTNRYKYRPSFFDKLFKRIETRIQKFDKAIELGVERDGADHRAAIKQYEIDHAEWQNLKELARKVLEGSPEAYTEALSSSRLCEQIEEIGKFSFTKIHSPNVVEVTIDDKGDNFVPAEYKHLTPTGKLSIRNMPKGKFYELYQKFVCSAAIRVAREVQALLPVNTVIINVESEFIDKAMGSKSKLFLLSAGIPENKIKEANLNMIDPAVFVKSLSHNIKLKKTQGFEPVEKVAVPRT